MKAEFHTPSLRRTIKALPPVLLPAVICLTACEDSSTAPAPLAAAADLDVSDCIDVPFRETDVFRTPLDNWRLAYGRLCPISLDALSGCTQLAGATEADIIACVRDNALADDDCPDAMRDSLLEAMATIEKASACRALYDDLSRRAIADATGPFDDLPQHHLDDIARVCHNRYWFNPDNARQCVAKRAADLRATLEHQQNLAALRQTRIAAFQAAVAAANLEPPLATDMQRALQEHCVAGTPAPDVVGECATNVLAALAAQRGALAPLPADRRRHTINRCMRARHAVLRQPAIADAECLREDAAAYAAIAAHYAEHLDGCGGTRRRYSEVINCTKARWLTRERVDTARGQVIANHVAHIEPDKVRDAVTRHCSRSQSHAAVTRKTDYIIPGESPYSILERRMKPCIDDHVGAFAALRHFAGSTHAAAYDRCIDTSNLRLYSWRAAVGCLRKAARRADDDPFADAFEPCVASKKTAADLINCQGIPQR